MCSKIKVKYGTQHGVIMVKMAFLFYHMLVWKTTDGAKVKENITLRIPLKRHR